MKEYMEDTKLTYEEANRVEAFQAAMNLRILHARHKYGPMKSAGFDACGNQAQHTEAFLKDFEDTMTRFIQRWSNGQSTTGTTNNVINILIRLKTYLVGGLTKGGITKPGNTEYLVDAANFAMIEFIYPHLKGAKFEPTTDAGSPGINGFTPHLLELQMEGKV